MSSRRDFIKKAGLTAGALSLPGIFEPLISAPSATELSEGFQRALQRVNQLSPVDAAQDEDFWNWVRRTERSRRLVLVFRRSRRFVILAGERWSLRISPTSISIWN